MTNPYRGFYGRLGGELLNEQRENEFGGASIVSVAYRWRSLRALSERLDLWGSVEGNQGT